MDQFIKYVGLDTHKDTIAVAIADIAGGKPRYYGEIANTPTALTVEIQLAGIFAPYFGTNTARPFVCLL